MFDIPVGVIPVPDTLTMVLVGVALLAVLGAGYWKYKREQKNEINQKVEDTIAQRAARADKREQDEG